MTFASSRPVRLAGFTIVRRLGAGGMGVVYEAIDDSSSGRVALKTLSNADASLLHSLKREFRALQGIHHPNVITLGELRQEADTWFFTMELIEGRDLFTWIRDGGTGEGRGYDSGLSQVGGDLTERVWAEPETDDTLPVSEPVAAVERAPIDPAAIGRLRAGLAQLASGLAELHRAGLVHRDLKPSNILVTCEGRLVILDFGLVHQFGADARSISQVVGTVAYMAPEQARGDELGPAADWYSVGVLLYEALTGAIPFSGSRLSIMVQKQAWIPVRPSMLAAGVPPDLDELCIALLHPDPAARPDETAILEWIAASAPAADLGDIPALARPRFVGRGDELGAIEESFASVDATRPSIVVVEGESGVGKTSLLSAAAARLAASPDAAVLDGRCFDRETVAYAGVDTVIDSLTALLRRLPAADLAFVMPRVPALLPLLFPVIASVPVVADAPPLKLSAGTREARARAFAAYRELLQRLSERRRIAILIDDAQWLTAESWAFLSALLEPLAPAPVLLVLAVRPGTDVLDRLDRLGLEAWLTHLRVGPLSIRESVALLRELAPEQAARPRVLETIVRESGGHPLFLQELSRVQTGDGEMAPTNLEEVLRARVAGLPDDQARVLRAVAAATAPLARGVVRAAAELEGEAAASAIAALRARRLIAGADETPHEIVRPYHDRIRMAALRDLPVAEIAALHGRIAAALEVDVAADPAVLAAEWSAAGDVRRAAPWAQQAGARAMQTLAFERAAPMYRLAIEGTDEPGERARLLTALGEALANGGRSAEAAQVYLEGARSGPADVVDDLLHRGAEHLIRSGQVHEGKSVLAQVLTRLGLRLFASRRMAMVALLWRRLRLRLRRLPGPGRLPGPADAATVRRIDASWAVGDMLSLLDPMRAAAAHAQGLLLALDLGDPFRLARALCTEAAFVSMTPGGRVRGRAMLAIARRLAASSPHPELPGWLAVGEGISRLLAGDFTGAATHFDAAEESFSLCIGAGWEAATARQFSAWNLAYLGDLPALRAKAAVAIEEGLLRENRLTVFNVSCGPSHILRLAEDRPVELLAACDDLLAGWDLLEYPMLHLCALFARSHALLYLGRGGEALTLIDGQARSIRRSHLLRSEFYRIDLDALKARVLVWMCVNQVGGARHAARARRLLRRLRRERAAWAHAQADALAACLAASRGDASAPAALADAAGALERVGLGLHAAAARVHLGGRFPGDDVRRPETLAATLIPFAPVTPGSNTASRSP